MANIRTILPLEEDESIFPELFRWGTIDPLNVYLWTIKYFGKRKEQNGLCKGGNTQKEWGQESRGKIGGCVRMYRLYFANHGMCGNVSVISIPEHLY